MKQPNIDPPKAGRPAHRLATGIRDRLKRFIQVEASSGVVLLATAILALLWANSPWAASYERLWHTPITIGFGAIASKESIHFWINDGLMTVFFLLVGLEIRREAHEGELSDWKRAALPIAAALGGMVAPAVIYLLFNREPPLRRGWGIPMATDIAFAVGVLTLLGRRVSPALRILLLALAVIDDVGAIIVIALFYSGGISAEWLLVATGGVVGLLLFQRAGVRHSVAYILPGSILWFGLLRAGIHPTIAGVIIGLLTPTRSIGRLQAALHPWVAFGIMPLFALANAGVALNGAHPGGANLTLTLGVILGLVFGKPMGILLATFAVVKMRLCTLPDGINWRGVFVVGCVAGIGFTMAVFIGGLAFAESSTSLTTSKLAVLVASMLAGVLALGVGSVLLPKAGAGE